MNKVAFIDIGELGWSLYLSAHMKWLKNKDHIVPAVMTLPGRETLYKNAAPSIFKVPSEFHKNYGGRPQSCFTLYGMSGTELKNYFNSHLPANYIVSRSQPFDCHKHKRIYAGKMLFTPYPYKAKLEGRKEILVFPRARLAFPFNQRNLPRPFYVALINRLCEEFSHFVIRTMGTKLGAYDITEVRENNYINFVGKTPNIQEVIDRCQIAIGAVGSQSAPLKLTLLQGVPTFMVGHQEERHVKKENWLKTKAGFYKVGIDNYGQFNFKDCIFQIIDFVGMGKQ